MEKENEILLSLKAVAGNSGSLCNMDFKRLKAGTGKFDGGLGPTLKNREQQRPTASKAKPCKDRAQPSQEECDKITAQGLKTGRTFAPVDNGPQPQKMMPKMNGQQRLPYKTEKKRPCRVTKVQYMQ